MIKNKIFRRLALLVSLIMLFTSTVNTTFGLIVTKTDSLINIFTPMEGMVSNLLITKAVEHPFGEEYVIPENVCFDFKVDFGLSYANTTVKTTNGEMVADENGSIMISVQPGKGFAVEEIDAGTKVTVTEIQKEGSGFAVKEGAVTKEGIVAEDGSLKIEFVNVYSPASVQPLNVVVGGVKILEGREWQSGDTFSFTLEQKTGEDTWTSLGTKTVTYDAENTTFNYFDFSDLVQALTFDKVGVYSFRMTEVLGNLENVDYDTSVNTFAIRVTDVDMDGKLEINSVTAAQNTTVKEAEGKYEVFATFNNTFVPAIPDPEDIAVKIEVDKTVKNTGVSTIGPAGFEFVLENTVSGEKIALKSDEGGHAVFTLPFTVADIGAVYTYRLSETDEGMAGITYDSRVYDISVEIALSEDNQLVATITMDGEKVDKAVAEFENTYHTELPKPDDISVAITVNKMVKNTGKIEIGPEGFEFVLENSISGEKAILTSKDNGKVIFVLPFTAEDIGKTYTYKLSERDNGEFGVTYDVRVYDISIAITLDENNCLKANIKMNDEIVTDAVAVFENIYNADNFEEPPTGDVNVAFWFVMMIVSAIACVVLILLDKRYAKLGC